MGYCRASLTGLGLHLGRSRSRTMLVIRPILVFHPAGRGNRDESILPTRLSLHFAKAILNPFLRSRQLYVYDKKAFYLLIESRTPFVIPLTDNRRRGRWRRRLKKSFAFSIDYQRGVTAFSRCCISSRLPPKLLLNCVGCPKSRRAVPSSPLDMRFAL